MDDKTIFSVVDHTLLKADATWDEISVICAEGLKFGTASVCIPPSFVKRAKDAFPTLNVCTVIGFPLGYAVTSVKVVETAAAVADGADEIDMVINIGWAREGRFGDVADEIAAVRAACVGKVLKVIIETCYLSVGEKIALCESVTKAGADYIKTSTGFGSAGATLEDVELFKKHIGQGVKIKAAGGVRTKADFEAFIAAGCSRIGTSGAVKALSGGKVEGY